MDRSRAAGWVPAVFVVYLLLAMVMTHPLWLHLDDAVPSDIGDPLLNTWTLAWGAHALLSDQLHLFDANIFYPLPNTLAYSEHLLAGSALALPIQGITGEPVAAYNLSLLLSFALCGLGMFLLCLRWTGRRSAAFLTGLVFAFAPYRLAAISHLQLLTFQWLPFTMLALDVLLERGDGNRSRVRMPVAAALFTLFTALQVLSSWYLAVFSALVLGLYVLAWLAARRQWRQVGKRLLWLTVCLAIAAALIIPAAYPYLAVLPQLQAARPAQMAAALTAQPGDFLAAAPFLRLPGPLTGSLRERPGFTEENTLYPGVLTSLLALLALALVLPAAFAARRRGATSGAFWRIAALAAILLASLALTFAGPYLALIQLAPALRVVRAPARWMMPATFALAGLAGHSLAWMQGRLRGRQALTVVSALIGLGVLAESFAVPLPLAAVGSMGDLPPVYPVLRQLTLTAAAPPGAVVELPMYVAPAPEYPETRRMLASRLGWWGLVNGYSGFTPPRQATLAAGLAGFPSPEAMATLSDLAGSGVRYLVVHPGEAPFERGRWQAGERYVAERGTTLLPLGDVGPDALYAVNPYGDTLITDPASVKDVYWATHAPAPLGCTFSAGSTRVRLLAYSLASEFSATDTLRLTLFWQTSARLDDDYTVFVHSLDAAGQLSGQADGPPLNDHYPTTAWQPGEIVQDSRLVPAGHSYLVGLYLAPNGERLPALAADGTRLPDDAQLIRQERPLSE